MKCTSSSRFKTVVSLLIILGLSPLGFAEKNSSKSSSQLAEERCRALADGYAGKKTKAASKEWMEKFSGDHGNCIRHYRKIYEGEGSSGSCNTINETFDKNYRGFVDLCAKAASVLPGSWPRGLHSCLAQVAECSQKNKNDTEEPSIVGALFSKTDKRCKPLQDIEAGRKKHPDSPEAKAEAQKADKQAEQAEKSREEVSRLREEKNRAYTEYVERAAERTKEARDKTEQLKDQRQELIERNEDEGLRLQAEKQNIETRITAANAQARQAHVAYLKALIDIERSCREQAQAAGDQTVAGLRGLVSRNAHRARGLGGALSYFGQGGIDGQGNITANNLYQYCSVANVQRRVSRLSKGASRIPSAQEQLIKSLKADLEEAKQTAKEAKNVEAEKLRLQVQAIQNYKKNTAERLALMTEKLNRVQPEFAEDMARMKHLFDKQQAELDQAIAQASAGQQGSTGLQGLLQNALSGVAEGKSPLDAVTGGALNQNNTGAKSEEDRDVIYQTISRSAGLFHDAELLLQRCPCNAECGPEGLANAEGGENCQRAKEFYDMYTEKFDVAGNCGEQISTSSVSSVNRRRFGNKKNVNNRRSKSKRTK